MGSLDEINQLLAEKQEELARLDARRAELLAQIAKLQQEKAPFLQLQERPDLKVFRIQPNFSTRPGTDETQQRFLASHRFC